MKLQNFYLLANHLKSKGIGRSKAEEKYQGVSQLDFLPA